MLDTLNQICNDRVMKKIRYKPYAKTSYLPANLKLEVLSNASELLPICEQLLKEVRRLELQAEHHQKIIDAQAAEIERLQGINRGQRDELFGRSSEKATIPDPADERPESEQTSPAQVDSAKQVNPRGGKKGHKGYGRKIPDLPEVEVVHEVPADQACCSTCGISLADTGLSEDSYELDMEIKLVRIKHIRKRAVRTCDCQTKRFVTAPKPPQVIPKGKFSHAFLAYAIVMKYLFQVPLHRLLQMMQMRGLSLTESTFIGTFQTLKDRLIPLYKRLIAINQSADHWHVDETGWKMFAPTDKKDNANWWLWVFACKQTVVYLVDASRSASVLLTYFKEAASGVISSDRYAAYLKLGRLRTGIINAFCWAHLRRDFLNAGKEHVRLQPWTLLWLARIRQLYRLNRERLSAVGDGDAATEAQAALTQGLAFFFAQIESELHSSDLHPKQRKILRNARKNQEALSVFVHRSYVPMDNNRAERLLRLAALGRNNYYGCHAEWSGEFTAICLTILQTATMHGLNAEAYLRYIFDELAAHPDAHPDVDSLLPWKIPADKMHAYQMKTGGLSCTKANSPETSVVGL
jgi:transposase